MKRMIRVLSCMLIVIATAGCSLSNKQIVKTKSFGTATSNIGKLGEEEFINIRKWIIEMNKELVSIDNTKKANSLTFDKPATVKATARRVAASKALKLYGDLLIKLVTADRSENIQQVANSLIDNTSTALKHELSDEKKGAINEIIIGLGSFWIEKKKAEAAKKIIPMYKQPVDELADLLSEDFSLDDDSLGFLKAYDATAKRLRNASMRLVNAGDKYSVLERDRAVQALVMAEKAIIHSKALGKKAKKTISSLKKANAELVKIIGDEKYSTDDIKEYAKQVQELVNMYQVLTN